MAVMNDHRLVFLLLAKGHIKKTTSANSKKGRELNSKSNYCFEENNRPIMPSNLLNIDNHHW